MVSWAAARLSAQKRMLSSEVSFRVDHGGPAVVDDRQLVGHGGKESIGPSRIAGCDPQPLRPQPGESVTAAHAKTSAS